METVEQCTGGRITKRVRRVQISSPLAGSGAESKRSIVNVEDSQVIPLPGGELGSDPVEMDIKLNTDLPASALGQIK